MKHPYFFHLKYESRPIYKPRPEKFELTQEGRELSSPSWRASCGPVADRLRTTSAKIAPLSNEIKTTALLVGLSGLERPSWNLETPHS